MATPRFSLANLSIKHRLPLLIGSLLLGVIIASTLAAYRGVRESSLEVGNVRLQSVTKQLAGLFQQSSALLLTKTATEANKPAITAFLKSPSPATGAEATAILEQFRGPQDPMGVQTELWDASHSLVLAVPNGASPEPADLETEFKTAGVEPFKTMGALRSINGTINFPAIAAVKDETGKPLGYLVRWRRTSIDPARKQLMELLGSDAALYFGNLRGDLFTDLERVVLMRQAIPESNSEVTHYSRDGNEVMGLGRPITGTPWFVLIEFPKAQFLAQTNRFLWGILLVDILLFTIGMAGAFTLSRNITRPLDLLTRSATEISGGDYSGKVHVHRNDELGVLGDSFNSMIATVRQSQIELVRKVEALGESEQRLQTVIENLSEGLVVSDVNGQLLGWNRAALELHGFSNLEEGLLKLPEFTKIFELTDLEGSVLDVDQWPLARVIRGERLRNLELKIRRLDSDWNRILSYGGALVREATGNFAAVVTMSDITERKVAEKDRLLLALIVEATGDAVIGKDLDGIITSWNKGAEKLYGYTPEEVIGRSIAVLFPPGQSHELERILDGIRRGETIEHFETWRVTKDGTRVFLSLSISPIRDQSDAISGSSIIGRNITARKQAEEALRASEIRYRRLFESAHDGILILDADSGRILDVNPFILQMLGAQKEDLMGHELWMLGPFKDIVASKVAFSELQDRGYIRYEDLPLEDNEGKIWPVEFVSNSYLAGGNRVIQCNIRDITERKLAEAELRRTNQRLEGALAELHTRTHELASMTQQLWQASKLATMGELAASVAHELNNPLATISLHNELLVSELADDDPQLPSLGVIEQEVERMASLVSNLLLFSRRGHNQISTVNIGHEVIKSLDFIQYHLRSHKIALVKDCSTFLPTIQADRQQLHQVFLNLITNASDAMPNGGILTVRTREGRMNDGRKAVVVEFSDTGNGIETGDLPRLWEPFFTTKPEGKGTGLGLGICRRTVEEHTGTIEIETAVGKGSTVRITLPATAEGFEVAA